MNDSNSWRVRYIYLNGQFVAQYSSNTTLFALSDHLGSTRALTQVNGTVLQSYDYQPFGELIAGGSSTTHKFTGKERDGESGLDHYLYRHLAPSTGRWTTPDPAMCSATDPQKLNRYSYVENDPTNRTDPLGLFSSGGWQNDVIVSNCRFLGTPIYDTATHEVVACRIAPLLDLPSPLPFPICAPFANYHVCNYYRNLERLATTACERRYARLNLAICLSYPPTCFGNCTRSCLVEKDAAQCTNAKDKLSCTDRILCSGRIHLQCWNSCGVIWGAP